jgi:hypothetical protein
VERRRTGPGDRQLCWNGRDGCQPVTCEAGEAHGEADGWVPTTVPQFQYRFKPDKLIQTLSTIFKKSNLVQSKKDLPELKQI